MRRGMVISFLTLGLAGAVAQTGVGAAPFLVGAWMDRFALDPRSASALNIAETLSFAFVMVGLAPRMAGLSLRWLGVCGSAGLVLAHVLSAYATPIVPLLICRAIAGICLGLLGAAANTAASRSADPERAYAAATGMMVVLFTLQSVSLPWSSGYHGPRGMLLFLAAVVLVCSPLWLWLDEAASTGDAVRPRPGGPWPPLRDTAGVLASMTLFSIGAAALWVFAERIGMRLQFSTHQIGAMMATAFPVSMLGSLAATWLGTRYGRTWPGAFGLVGTGLSCLLLAQSWNGVVYWIGLTLYFGIWWIAYAYILGTAAAIDRDGRVATATGGAFLFASAAGAGIGGVVASLTDYATVGWIALGVCILAAVALWPVSRRADRLPPQPNPVAIGH